MLGGDGGRGLVLEVKGPWGALGLSRGGGAPRPDSLPAACPGGVLTILEPGLD